MKVLITGAAGFIGSHLTSFLLKHGIEVVCVDRLSDYYSNYYKKIRFTSLNPGVELIEKDISSINARDLRDVDIFIHLAAQPGVRVNSKSIPTYIDDNISAFSSALSLALKSEIPKFIYASSSSVYERAKIFPFSESEDLPSPKGFYAFSKWSAESIATAVSKETDMKIIGLRFFTVYGPWGRPDMAFTKLLFSATWDSPFLVNGSLEVSRDFTYITDVCQILIDLMSKSKSLPLVINIGKGAPLKLRTWADLMEKQVGKKIHFEFGKRNNLDAEITQANPKLLQEVLAKKPAWTSPENALIESMQWLSKNRDLSKVFLPKST